MNEVLVSMGSVKIPQEFRTSEKFRWKNKNGTKFCPILSKILDFAKFREIKSGPKSLQTFLPLYISHMSRIVLGFTTSWWNEQKKRWTFQNFGKPGMNAVGWWSLYRLTKTGIADTYFFVVCVSLEPNVRSIKRITRNVVVLVYNDI